MLCLQNSEMTTGHAEAGERVSMSSHENCGCPRDGDPFPAVTLGRLPKVELRGWVSRSPG